MCIASIWIRPIDFATEIFCQPKKTWSLQRPRPHTKNERTFFIFYITIYILHSSRQIVEIFRIFSIVLLVGIKHHHYTPLLSIYFACLATFLRRHKTLSTEYSAHKTILAMVFATHCPHLYSCQLLLLYFVARFVIVNSCVVEQLKFIHCDFSNLIQCNLNIRKCYFQYLYSTGAHNGSRLPFFLVG